MEPRIDLYLADLRTGAVIFPHDNVLRREGSPMMYRMDRWTADPFNGHATVYVVPVGGTNTQRFSAAEFGLTVCKRVPGVKPARGNHKPWKRD